MTHHTSTKPASNVKPPSEGASGLGVTTPSEAGYAAATGSYPNVAGLLSNEAVNLGLSAAVGAQVMNDLRGSNSGYSPNQIYVAGMQRLQELAAAQAGGGTLGAAGVAGAGGSGGYGGMSPEQKANMTAEYRLMLQNWGIPLNSDAGKLINQAVNGNWSSGRFLLALRNTKAYKQAFPGLDYASGMTEAEYLSNYRQYTGMAQDAGYKLSRGAFGDLMKKGIDATEWNLRVGAYKQVKTNKPLFDAFEDVLKARGLAKGKLDPKELKDMLTGTGSGLYAKVWNEASVTAGLEGIGFDIGKQGDVTRKQLLHMLKAPVGALAPGETLQVDYAALAETAAKALPASRLYGMGITKKSLVQMALGGKNAQETAALVTRALGTAEAFATEQRATPNLYPGGGMNEAAGAQPAIQATE